MQSVENEATHHVFLVRPNNWTLMSVSAHSC